MKNSSETSYLSFEVIHFSFHRTVWIIEKNPVRNNMKVLFFHIFCIFYFGLSSWVTFTALKMKFSIGDFFNKCDQICRKLRIWSHLLKKSPMEDFIFCAVLGILLRNWKLEIGSASERTTFIRNFLYARAIFRMTSTNNYYHRKTLRIGLPSGL